MKLKVIINEAEEGGYWAEVPANSWVRHTGRNVRGAPAEPLRGHRGMPLSGR